MIPSTARIAAAMQARIAASPHTVTVVYPPRRPVAAGTAPGPAPVNPLTGTAPAETLVPAATTPAKASVTLQCLWYNEQTMSDLRRYGMAPSAGGWIEGATALAALDAEDVVVGGTSVLVGADYLEHDGKRYKVLQVTPAGPAFAAPYVFYAWLVGGA